MASSTALGRSIRSGGGQCRALACRHRWSAPERRDGQFSAFFNQRRTAGKKLMRAAVAMMRKLPHAIWGMLEHDQDFDGNNVFKIANENVCQKQKHLALSIERSAAGGSVSGAHGAR
jgi:hypothetical protein